MHLDCGFLFRETATNKNDGVEDESMMTHKMIEPRYRHKSSSKMKTIHQARRQQVIRSTGNSHLLINHDDDIHIQSSVGDKQELLSSSVSTSTSSNTVKVPYPFANCTKSYRHNQNIHRIKACLIVATTLAICNQYQSSLSSYAQAATSSIIDTTPSFANHTNQPKLINQITSGISSISALVVGGGSGPSKRDTDAASRQIANVCQVYDGESVAIVEIEESRGSDTSQGTNPAELPISGRLIGDLSDQIELRIESETHKYFKLDNRRLKLTRPLDRDAILRENSTTQIGQQPISSIYLQISCTDKRLNAAQTGSGNNRTTTTNSQIKKVIIPVLVKVLDLNDNAPRFSQATYTVQVDELSPVGTIITNQVYAIDLDSANNGHIEYSLVGNSPKRPQAAQMSLINSRLVQRAEPRTPIETTTLPRASSTTSSSSSPTTTTTTTQTPPPTTTTTTASSSPPSISPTRASAAGNSESRPDNTSDDDTDDDNNNSNNNNASATTTTATGHRNLAGQTINLNSEPILNGPMDDLEEEESDEALLASLNGSNSTSLTDQPEDEDALIGDLIAPLEGHDIIRASAVTSMPGARPARRGVAQISGYGNSRRRRRRRRRRRSHAADEKASDAPADVSIGDRAPATTTTTTTTSSSSASTTSSPINEQTTTSKSVSSKRDLPPWTNLMVLPAERELLLSEDAPLLTPVASSDTDYFSLEISPQTGRPIIRLIRPLDYETKRMHSITIQASDLATNVADRLIGRATILIKVLDGDDLPPVFVLDQSGCATNSPPQTTTTPTPSGLRHLPQLSSAGAVGKLVQAPVLPGAAEVNNLAAATSSATSDESSFDFGDALALDDSPIEDFSNQPQHAAALLGLNSTSRARRVPISHQHVQDQRAFGSSLHAATGSRQFHECLSMSSSSAASQAFGGQLAEYRSTIMSGDSEYLLRIVPQSIKARDRDELNAPIRYTIINSTLDNYHHYFQINALDATIKQIAPIERLVSIPGISKLQAIGPGRSSSSLGQSTGSSLNNHIILWIQAQEVSQNKLASLAKLTVEVVPSDKSPPVLVPNSYAGFIEENSPIGSRVSVTNWREVASRASVVNNSNSSLNNGAKSPLSSSSSYLRIQVLDGESPSSQHTGATRLLSSSLTGSGSNINIINKFDFDTTSDVFKIDQDGFLYVATSSGQSLDCDLPNQAYHVFQVTARQVGLATSRSISSPISLNVSLLDVNDNGPVFVNSSLAGPIHLSANSRGGAQFVSQLRALDKDHEPENCRMHFALKHVSNNGKDRFRLDDESGRIEALGAFHAGEQFSLTVQVSDDLGRSSQGIVEVVITPGANTNGPQFVDYTLDELLGDGATGSSNQSHSPPAGATWPQNKDSADSPESRSIASVSPSSSSIRRINNNNNNNINNKLNNQWAIEVSEAVAIGSVVLQIRAIDPENDPIAFHIADGNTNGDFQLNSRTGLLTVAHKLDREEIGNYNLLVQARDSGGLATSRQLRITVTDSNDQNPVFQQAHYVFSVPEGVRGIDVGRVGASDGDLGENGRVVYSLIEPTASVVEPKTIRGRNGLSSELDDDQYGLAHSSGLFAIDPETGDIKLLKALDYEQTKSYSLLVQASDQGENPRSSSVSVLIRVLDIQDEAPYFERYYFETKIEENLINQRLAQVLARDPDSQAQITYQLLAGDSQLFQVDAKTGLVTTSSASGLDYEQSKTHTILVGTNESSSLASFDLVQAANLISDSLANNQQLDRSPIVRIDIQVLDKNDNAPQFIDQQIMPIRVQDTLPLGHQLIRMQAQDSDGSAPNNQIRYDIVTATSNDPNTNEYNRELKTSDKCNRLFLIDPSSGWVSIRSDLRHESISECQLIVRARDLAEPASQSLSSIISLSLLIDHLAETSPASMIGFADSSFTVELSENLAPNSLVRILPVVNKPRTTTTTATGQTTNGQSQQQQPDIASNHVDHWPMSCEILNGNELGLFYVIANDQHDCELRTSANNQMQLDYELKSRFLLTIRLNTLGSGPITSPVAASASSGQLSSSFAINSQQKLIAQVQINLVDQNDVRPRFQEPPARYGHLTQHKYLAAIASDSPSETQVIQMRAIDSDGQANSNGLVSYELLNENELEQRFKIDPVDGIIRTSKPIEDVPVKRLPIKLRVLARDNPELASQTLDSSVEIIVNLIDDKHRLCLALKDTPAGRVLDSREELLGALQERTGLISGLERVESLKLQRNSSLTEPDVSGTDFWFYLIEPGTLKILPSDDVRIQSTLLDLRGQNSLYDVISQTLGFNKAKIRLPFSLQGAHLAHLDQQSRSIVSMFLLGALQGDTHSGARLAPSLILVALFIAVIGAIVVIYQCGSAAGWSLAATSRRNANLHHQQQQQLQHHQVAALLAAKDKLFNYCTTANSYPAQYQINNGPSNGVQTPSVIDQSRFNSMTDPYHQHQSIISSSHQSQLDANNQCLNGNYNNNNNQFAINSKEYETQMLKMSVLFDDQHSLDEQNCLNSENQMINKNLV